MPAHLRPSTARPDPHRLTTPSILALHDLTADRKCRTCRKWARSAGRVSIPFGPSEACGRANATRGDQPAYVHIHASTPRPHAGRGGGSARYLGMEHFSQRHEPLMADLVADMTRQPSATTKEVWQLGFIPPAHLRLPWYDYTTAEESTTESRAAAHPSIPPPLYHSSLTINDEVRRPGHPVSRQAAHTVRPSRAVCRPLRSFANRDPQHNDGSATRGSTPSMRRTDPRGVMSAILRRI